MGFNDLMKRQSLMSDWSWYHHVLSVWWYRGGTLAFTSFKMMQSACSVGKLEHWLYGHVPCLAHALKKDKILICVTN